MRQTHPSKSSPRRSLALENWRIEENKRRAKHTLAIQRIAGAAMAKPMLLSTPAIAGYCQQGEHGKCATEGGVKVYTAQGKTRCECTCHSEASHGEAS